MYSNLMTGEVLLVFSIPQINGAPIGGKLPPCQFPHKNDYIGFYANVTGNWKMQGKKRVSIIRNYEFLHRNTAYHHIITSTKTRKLEQDKSVKQMS